MAQPASRATHVSRLVECDGDWWTVELSGWIDDGSSHRCIGVRFGCLASGEELYARLTRADDLAHATNGELVDALKAGLLRLHESKH